MKEYKRILWKNRKSIGMLTAWMILAAAVSVAAGYSLSWILNVYEAEGNRLLALIRAVLASVGTYAAAILMEHCGEVLQFKMQRIIKNDLRDMVSRKIAGLSYDEFGKRDSGVYVSWLSNDVDQLYASCFQQLFAGVQYGFSAVFALSVMMANSWYLGAAAVGLFVLQFVIPQMLNGLMERAAKDRSEALEVSMEAYKDTLMGVGIFYLNNLRERIAERIVAASDGAEKRMFASNRTIRRVNTALGIVSMVNQLALTAVAMLAAIIGDAPVGIAFAVGNLCGQFFNGISCSVQSVMSIRSTKPIWEKFEGEEKREEEKQALGTVQRISMHDVSFGYGEQPILENRSFDFEQGGKYAILGESGSGKSTLLKLMMGLLPGYKGDILYDHTEQKQAEMSSFYGQTAYVEQQVYLFQDSLRFNITLGENYSDEEVMEAVKACRLEALAESMPEGLDSIISENGKNLSGGQRQRIALARGFIRKARYIILDEGTSALDEENASDIEQNLMEQDGLGVIIITHNLRDSVRRQLTRVYQM